MLGYLGISIHFSNARPPDSCIDVSVDENDIEIVVTTGNWQISGRPPRWNWQVRQKRPSKLLVKGVTMGEKHDAVAAAQAAKAKFLVRLLLVDR